MKTILVTGCNGQLGNAIRKQSHTCPSFKFLYADIDTLDLSDKTAVESFFTNHSIDYVVNCAAYTAVDKAEDEEALCYKVNCEAVKILGTVASSCGARMIHISTDYVFDGTNNRPYVETDAPCPTSVYGKTKLAGEEALMSVCPASVIIRTSWLYSEFGANFVKTMLRLGNEREELRVIFDQIGTPTYAGDLATAIMSVIDADEFVSGIYHYSNEGVCSWYDFTVKIVELAGYGCRVMPIETKDYPTRASRPQYSVLNKKRIKNIYNIEIPHWEESLRKMFPLLK